MANDEIGAIKLMDLQKEAIAGNLNNREQLRREVWKWILENDEDPRDVERTLIRYSENFSPAAGGQPLALGDEPPEDLQE